MPRRFNAIQVSLIAACFVSWICSASLATGQEGTFTFSPDTGPPGTLRTITLTAPPTSGLHYIAVGCQLQQAWSGGPNGTPVPLFGPVCAVIPITVPPCGSISGIWTPPANLAPGTWWMRFDYLQLGTFQAVTKWVDFRIDSPPEPTLTAPAPITGQTWSITLSHPPLAGTGYIAAASLTTDTGITISPTQVLSLDPDFLFLESFPNPNPLLFSNFQGTLDATGAATLGIQIPNVPGINCIGLHVQAFVLSPTGAGLLSNCLDSVIQ